MKQGNNNRRARGRGPRKPHGMGSPNKNQPFDSNGPEVRVRGNAHQVLERYLQLARDAGAAGDRVAAENYLQHADHYYRVLSAAHEGQRPRVGGREFSVADVNVQNVNQGLSAALYVNSGGMPQGQGNSDEQAGQAVNVAAQPAAPANGRSFENYDAQRPSSDSRDSRSQERRPPAAAAAPSDDQPDYPEELLPTAPEPQTASPALEPSEAPATQEDARPQRTLRGRGRGRGPGRRQPRSQDEAAVPDDSGGDSGTGEPTE